MGSYYATEEEIAKIIYDTDIYEKIGLVVRKRTYETNYLVSIITNNINIHYSYFLKDMENPIADRRNYLIDHIEGELSCYLNEANLT